MSEWIKCSERLPEPNEHVLVCCDLNGYCISGSYMCVAFRTDDMTTPCDYNDDIDSVYDEDTDEYYFPVGWWEVIITYCQYGDTRMKPTDIWTNHPNPQFKPPCHNGDECHASAPRGAKTGTQGLKGSIERSKIPNLFCEHVVDICERGDAE